jgi:hypothetical protein
LSYYNKYNKKLVNDDNNDQRYSRDSSFGFDSSFSNIHDNIGLSYGLTFFLKERKKHYKKLNDVVFRPLSLLTNINNGYNLLDSLKIGILIDESIPMDYIVYRDAMLHLKEDYPDLPEMIHNIKDKIHMHNSKVESLDKLIDRNIDNYAKQYYIRPTSQLFPKNNHIDYNYYQKKEVVKKVVTDSWNHIIILIKNPIDVQSINKMTDEYITKNIRFRKKSNPFELEIEPGITIAFGKDENELDKIREFFINNILKNEDIIQELVCIINKKISLEKDIDYIRISANDISYAIDIDYYNKKVKCCPTAMKLLRNYGI